MCNNNLQIRIAGSLNRCQKNMLVTMVMIPFCVNFKYLFINWSWLNSLYILTYIPLVTKQHRTTSDALGNGKRFMLLRTKVTQWLLKISFAMVCDSDDKFSWYPQIIAKTSKTKHSCIKCSVKVFEHLMEQWFILFMMNDCSMFYCGVTLSKQLVYCCCCCLLWNIHSIEI